MTIVVLTEKPQVARDIAAALGARQKKPDHLAGNGYLITWALGHLLRLAEPHEIDAAWRRWQLSQLPMLPKRWPLIPIDSTRARFAFIKEVFNARTTREIICATDAGREGELIFRTIYQEAKCRKPVKRLWISSLTPDAIRRGFAALQPASRYDDLASAAQARSEADWLVGMNLSRVYGLRLAERLSVGRVQTPTLAMVVARDEAIRDFVPETTFLPQATFALDADSAASYSGILARPQTRPQTRPQRQHPAARTPRDEPDVPWEPLRLAREADAAAIADRVRHQSAVVSTYVRRERDIPPPHLFDLTALQRHINRAFGLSAEKTLEVAQALYEKYKLITYPRTDSQHLTPDVAASLPDVIAHLRPRYGANIAEGSGERPLSSRFVDARQVSDHHAIIPTPTPCPLGRLRPHEEWVYDAICRRLLMAWHPSYRFAATLVITDVGTAQADHFMSRGTTPLQQGWKCLERSQGSGAGADARTADTPLPAGLQNGSTSRVTQADVQRHTSKPKPPLTDATLLSAMEHAGQQLDDPALASALRDCGLGTPATRAATIETLLRRNYLRRQGRALRATDKGFRLIEAVHPDIKSPALTGVWERRLRAMQRGEERYEAFMEAIARFVATTVDSVKRAAQVPGVPAAQPAGVCARPPVRNADPATQVTQAIRQGQRRILVHGDGDMRDFTAAFTPQLPGCNVIVCPDATAVHLHTAALLHAGLQVAWLTAERDREASRRACLQYVAGSLQAFVLSSERLEVTGVVPMLGKLPRTTVTVDATVTPPTSVPDVFAPLRRHLLALGHVAHIWLTDPATRAHANELLGQTPFVCQLPATTRFGASSGGVVNAGPKPEETHGEEKHGVHR